MSAFGKVERFRGLFDTRWVDKVDNYGKGALLHKYPAILYYTMAVPSCKKLHQQSSDGGDMEQLGSMSSETQRQKEPAGSMFPSPQLELRIDPRILPQCAMRLE